MFDELIVWYLFLGGGGSGMSVLLCLADLLRLCGIDRKGLTRGFSAAAVALLAGALCLLADLGRPERFYYVFVFPTASLLTAGSAVLACTLLGCGVLAAVGAFNLAFVPRWLIRACEVVTAAAGLATALYTGALLAQINAVAYWNPVLPVLFAASAISVGAAGVFACCSPLGPGSEGLCRMFVRLDSAAVACEALAFALWAIVAARSVGAGVFADAVLFGPQAPALWLGFVGCGVAVPIAAGIAQWYAANSRLALAAAGLVAVGGFSLRYCIVNVPFF